MGIRFLLSIPSVFHIQYYFEATLIIRTCDKNLGTFKQRVWTSEYYLLTPWSRVLPEKLKRPELTLEIHRIYGTRRFITAFTRARHLSLS
jgi:hypothetical protein